MQELNQQQTNFIPHLTSIVDEMLENGQEVFESTLSLKENDSFSINDYLTKTVSKTVVAQQTGLWVCYKHLQKCKELELTTDQQEKINHLKHRMVKVKNITDDILKLTESLTKDDKDFQENISWILS